MKQRSLPNSDSVQALANFWDSHDITDFERDLEEVTEPVFHQRKEASVRINLPPREIQRLRKIAKSKGVNAPTVLREWILERLHESS